MNKINQFTIAMPYSFKANKVNKNNEINAETAKISQDLNKMSVLGKSQINFRGGSFKLDPNDRLFVGAIATAFGLSASVVDKVKGVISDYLVSNNYKSMSDIGGEENIDRQCDLTEKINDVINLDDRNYERLVGKVIDRCDEGDNYFPSEDTDELVTTNIIQNAFADLRKKIIENDERLIKSIAATLELNSEESRKLYKFIDDYMKEANLKSFKEFGNEDKIGENAMLIEKISQEFNLSEDDETLIEIEMTRRIFANENDYMPIIHPLDRNNKFASKDGQILYKILGNYNIKQNDAEKLHFAMKCDAYENSFKSIFETFKDNKYSRFNTNFILNSNTFKEIKEDILIDLFSCAKKFEQMSAEIDISNQQHNDRYSQHCAALCLLDEKFNFTEEQIKELKIYFREQEIDMNNSKDIWKAAYEIPDLFNFPLNSSTLIAKILRSINLMDKEELDGYHFKYCQMIMSKRSNHE